MASALLVGFVAITVLLQLVSVAFVFTASRQQKVTAPCERAELEEQNRKLLAQIQSLRKREAEGRQTNADILAQVKSLSEQQVKSRDALGAARQALRAANTQLVSLKPLRPKPAADRHDQGNGGHTAILLLATARCAVFSGRKGSALYGKFAGGSRWGCRWV